jgi:DNA polymerase III sliding clamp (beta) subunit (PCNA family)
MLEALKFVQGSVAKKEFIPALTHFVIENHTVRGYNGVIALSSQIPFDIACKPRAEALIKAIGSCDSTVQLSLTQAGRLSVRSGKFRALVECVDGPTPHAVPGGIACPVDGPALLAGLRAVAPFIGEDSARPWCQGVLLRGPSIYATNNVTLVEYWAGSTLPVVVTLPKATVKELLRIDEPPLHAQYDASSVTFHYGAGKWLRSHLLPNDWPDLSRILDVAANPVEVSPELFSALAIVKPFVNKNGAVRFTSDGIQTHTTIEEGAAYELDGLFSHGVFNLNMLNLLKGVALTADFSTYPKPCLFFGERLRGAIVGLRE